MNRSKYRDLLRPDPDPEFVFVDPPFTFNAPAIAKYPPEVSGARLLNSMARRLGWASLAGKRLLDFGCGVRLARTILNLGIEIGHYAGVDVKQDAIGWLKANVSDARFRFERIDLPNVMYNVRGAAPLDPETLARLGLTGFDAACMFSVITHQSPEEAEAILTMLRPCVPTGGSLYFTALIDDKVETYAELDPAKPRLLSAYHPDFLLALVNRCGWDVSAVYAPTTFQQTALVCRKRGT